eukprot:Rmarinus@m.15397
MTARDKLEQTLREWDKGSKQQRLSILNTFIKQHGSKTCIQIERELGNGASLFLARISAWLRLTYLLNIGLSTQLRALSIFLGSSSDHRYLNEFTEVGGLITVIEMIALKKIEEGNRRAAMSLLMNISSSGRTYKELICESKGPKKLCTAMTYVTEESTMDVARSIFLALARGNPRYYEQVHEQLVHLVRSSKSEAVRVASQCLRMLMDERSFAFTPDVTFARATLSMLTCDDFQVLYEATENVKKIVECEPMLTSFIVDGLQVLLVPNLYLAGLAEVEHTGDVADEDGAEEEKLRTSGKNHDFVQAKLNEKKGAQASHTQQAGAAKLIGTICEQSEATAKRFLDAGIVFSLVKCMAYVDHYEVQKQAAITLHFLCKTFVEVEESAYVMLGETLFETVMSRPELIHRSLTEDRVSSMREKLAELEATGSEENKVDPMASWEKLMGLQQEDTFDASAVSIRQKRQTRVGAKAFGIDGNFFGAGSLFGGESEKQSVGAPESSHMSGAAYSESILSAGRWQGAEEDIPIAGETIIGSLYEPFTLPTKFPPFLRASALQSEMMKGKSFNHPLFRRALTDMHRPAAHTKFLAKVHDLVDCLPEFYPFNCAPTAGANDSRGISSSRTPTLTGSNLHSRRSSLLSVSSQDARTPGSTDSSEKATTMVPRGVRQAILLQLQLHKRQQGAAQFLQVLTTTVTDRDGPNTRPVSALSVHSVAPRSTSESSPSKNRHSLAGLSSAASIPPKTLLAQGGTQKLMEGVKKVQLLNRISGGSKQRRPRRSRLTSNLSTVSETEVQMFGYVSGDVSGAATPSYPPTPGQEAQKDS